MVSLFKEGQKSKSGHFLRAKLYIKRVKNKNSSNSIKRTLHLVFEFIHLCAILTLNAGQKSYFYVQLYGRFTYGRKDKLIK